MKLITRDGIALLVFCESNNDAMPETFLLSS